MPNHDISVPSLPLKDFLSAFGLDHANIKDINIFHDDSHSLCVYIELNIREHFCPVCHTSTTKVKGYQLKKINHAVLNPVPCTIHYRARRYLCPVCGKTFYEHNPFVSGNLKASVATVYNVLNELRRPQATFSYVADKYHMSASSVANIFDHHIQPNRRSLPECLCFDET